MMPPEKVFPVVITASGPGDDRPGRPALGGARARSEDRHLVICSHVGATQQLWSGDYTLKADHGPVMLSNNMLRDTLCEASHPQ